MVHELTTCLWFDAQAEAAATFYTSLFPNSKIGRIARYAQETAKVSGQPAGSVMTVEFQLQGQKFLALNGGPQFKFNEAVSLIVPCDSQAEIDKFWNRLSAGGKKSRCGWLKDKFGVSWQIVPKALSQWMSEEDPQVSQRVMRALLKMDKLNIKKLQAAAKGPS